MSIPDCSARVRPLSPPPVLADLRASARPGPACARGLRGLLAFCLAGVFGGLRADVSPDAMESADWRLAIDPNSGALIRIENPRDPRRMNWLRDAGRWDGLKWRVDPGAVTRDGQWGLVQTAQFGLLHVATTRRLSERAWESVYQSSVLTVTVRRELDEGGGLSETYTFRNTGRIAIEFPVGTLSITAPFFDQYPDARTSQAARCHAHVWMGGSSSWINATHMGGRAPHLGLVLTSGSLDAYSVQGAGYNDRGVFLLHPAGMRLEHGKSVTLSWRLFWHEGWDDFFAKLAATGRFVRMSAKEYTVTAGRPVEIVAESNTPFEDPALFVDGKRVESRLDEKGRLVATIPTDRPGERLVELRDKTRKTWLRAQATPEIDALVDARVRFMVRHQQRRAPGDPLDGAYLA